jgi:hypothetical protein
MENLVTRRQGKEVREIIRRERGNNTITGEKCERGKRHRFVAIKQTARRKRRARELGVRGKQVLEKINVPEVKGWGL